MMGYEGGDLLLTGVAWPMVRSPPMPVCAGCGQWPVWLAALVSDESALEAAWPPDHRPERRRYGVRDDALYKSTFFTFFTYVLSPPLHERLTDWLTSKVFCLSSWRQHT